MTRHDAFEVRTADNLLIGSSATFEGAHDQATLWTRDRRGPTTILRRQVPLAEVRLEDSGRLAILLTVEGSLFA